MNISDSYGRQVPVGRISEDGSVFDINGYDTGQKVPVAGVTIRDSSGREVHRASVGRDGVVRDGDGRVVPNYRRLE